MPSKGRQEIACKIEDTDIPAPVDRSEFVNGCSKRNQPTSSLRLPAHIRHPQFSQLKIPYDRQTTFDHWKRFPPSLVRCQICEVAGMRGGYGGCGRGNLGGWVLVQESVRSGRSGKSRPWLRILISAEIIGFLRLRSSAPPPLRLRAISRNKRRSCTSRRVSGVPSGQVKQ